MWVALPTTFARKLSSGDSCPKREQRRVELWDVCIYTFIVGRRVLICIERRNARTWSAVWERRSGVPLEDATGSDHRGGGGKRRDRPRQRTAVAAQIGPAAFSCAHHGQARHHGAQDFPLDRQAASRPHHYRGEPRP